MKCPHCGSKMHPDQVFCEVCGKERLLVPVFEPEIEERVAQSMSGIVQELSPEEGAGKTTYGSAPGEEEKADAGAAGESRNTAEPLEEKQKREETLRGFHQVSFFVTSLVAVIILVSVFSIAFFVYTQNSYGYQYEKACTAFEAGEYEEALSLADRALELYEDSLDARMLKIRVYEARGETDQVLERSLAYLKRDPLSQESYERIIAIYIEREEFARISSLLETCEVPAVTEKYADYAASAPEIDTRGGLYDGGTSVKLIASGTGNIYYTLDGSEPNKYSDRYTAPIRLVSGSYVLKAVYINHYGIISDTVTEEYRIINGEAPSVEISADSGVYEMPVVIEVTVPDEESVVYYTTDGSEPEADSNLYSTPFPMPLGHSTYRFLMVDAEGNESKVVDREYDCEPVVNFTVEQALIMLKQNLIARGELLDINGSVNGSEDKKEYVCNSAISQDDIVYYMIYEYIKNPDGAMIRSGNIYAFSVLDGRILKAFVGETGNFLLSEL